MKNKLSVLAFTAAMLTALPALAASGVPAILTFTQGAQFRLPVSSTDPNLIFVPGDRVQAITAQAGMIADKRITSSGGVLFTTVAKDPFTLYVETTSGQTFSVVATPVKGQGHTYRLLSAEPSPRTETRQWETGQPYETLLISLSRAALTGRMPDGYGEADPLRSRSTAPAGLVLTPVKAWAGNLVRVDRYSVRNTLTRTVSLREQDFWTPGVRAVMFDNNVQSLLGGGVQMVTIIRSFSGGDDGKR